VEDRACHHGYHSCKICESASPQECEICKVYPVYRGNFIVFEESMVQEPDGSWTIPGRWDCERIPCPEAHDGIDRVTVRVQLPAKITDISFSFA